MIKFYPIFLSDDKQFMWSLLYQLASPKLYYELSGRIIPWLKWSALFFLSIGAVWGLVFAPPDYQQGNAFRIIYVHVPCAFLSMALCGFLGFLSILLIVWRIKLAGIMLRSVAQIGASMAFLALMTGSIWGKPMWGTWWVWDARLTSELILFLLYAAIIATAHAFQYKSEGDKVVAILCLVGLIDLPIIHYSVYWWNTLHQGSTVLSLSKPKIDNQMLYPLLIMIVGFALYCAFIIVARSRNELLWRERRQKWVKRIVVGENF